MFEKLGDLIDLDELIGRYSDVRGRRVGTVIGNGGDPPEVELELAFLC